jgi:predicted transcriptional regulator
MTPSQIREQRTRLSLSQLELSRRAQVSRFRLHTFEHGGGPPLTAEEITRILGSLRERASQIRQRLAEAGV